MLFLLLFKKGVELLPGIPKSTSPSILSWCRVTIPAREQLRIGLAAFDNDIARFLIPRAPPERYHFLIGYGSYADHLRHFVPMLVVHK